MSCSSVTFRPRKADLSEMSQKSRSREIPIMRLLVPLPLSHSHSQLSAPSLPPPSNTMRTQLSQEAKDLEILQKEYRNMEVNRKSFAEESHLVLRQQQQKLEKLRKENDGLKADVATLQTRNSHKPMTSFEQDQLAKLYEESARYKDLIESEKELLKTTQEQISARRKQIWEHRRTMGGVNAAAENQRLVEKQVRILENRLDQALVKFNKSLASNRKLRQEIDDLRGERVGFDSVSKKLEKSLNDKKRQMAEVIEQSNLAFEQRDRAQLEIMAIEQANRKEQEAFDHQMNEMRRQLDEELQVTTAKPKPDPAVTAAEEAAKAEAERKAAVAAALAKEKEELAQKRLQRLRIFEEAFRKISAATGVSNVDDLVSSFIANEEQNFSLYSYVNEQADEVELLEGQAQELQQEETRQAQEDGYGVNQYEQVLQDMDAKMKASREETEKLEQQCEDAQRTAESIKDAIKLLLTRMDCQEEITGDEGITDANMLHCLGAVEGKVNEILSRYRSLGCDRPSMRETSNDERTPAPASVSARNQGHVASPSSSRTNLLGSGPSGPMSPEPIYVMPPRLEDENDEDENPTNRPLTRTELQKLTANRLGNVQQPNIRRATLMGDRKGRRRSMMPLAGQGRRGTLGQGYSMSTLQSSAY